ncbi:alpha/beta fold hydrolase [Streptomyces sp. NPDC059850]|uniref:alpha/beta fold hydrolase n=1 Tax=Streptomyces sp. NPDC059850 TaxID=3346970 RepID=UPI003647F22B
MPSCPEGRGPEAASSHPNRRPMASRRPRSTAESPGGRGRQGPLDLRGLDRPELADPDTLAVWGAGDEIFGPDGARAFARDRPDAEIHLVPGGGHFLLESHLDIVAGYIRGFLTTAAPPA